MSEDVTMDEGGFGDSAVGDPLMKNKVTLVC